MSIDYRTIQWDKNKTAQAVLELFKNNPDKSFNVYDVIDETGIKTDNVQGVRNYINALLKRQLLKNVTVLPRKPHESAYYQWSNELLEMDMAPDSVSAKAFADLVDKAHKFRTGELGHEEALQWDRTALEHVYKMLSQEERNIKALLDNPDLWNKWPLVERLGFIGDHGDSKDPKTSSD